MTDDDSRVRQVLLDIEAQCNRHRVSSKSEELLINDLEIIERKVMELRSVLPKCVTPTGMTDAHGTYVRTSVINGVRRMVCTFCGEPVNKTCIECGGSGKTLQRDLHKSYEVKCSSCNGSGENEGG